ncbi:MAG: hypothetical protein KBS35_01565 [Mycoplasma sp.]|nr:hypothetical protein [Candidatus Hennigella equi]
MKDTKQIRKLLFLGKSNIALLVMHQEQDNNTVLYANQINVEPANLQVKISQLLTDAANFLGFNIKDVEMIFDDEQIARYSFTNQEFVDCNNEEDISKEIFKKAKIDNYFVNEINFMGIEYDEIDKVARVNCDICAGDYITYKKYLKAVKACNVNVTNSVNLYKLLKTNKDEIELTIKIVGDKAIACEYYGNKLNNVKTIAIKMDEIKQHIADKFDIKVNKVDNILAIANTLTECQNDDVNVVNDYHLKTKTFNSVKVRDVVALYRDEIKCQINEFVDFRNFHNVRIISDLAINALEGFAFAVNDNDCFANLSLDKIICLNNLDANKEEINQFSFENKLKSVDLAA